MYNRYTFYFNHSIALNPFTQILHIALILITFIDLTIAFYNVNSTNRSVCYTGNISFKYNHFFLLLFV